LRSIVRFVAPPGPCAYLSGETWSLEYEIVAEATPAEFAARLEAGWRRFGPAFFRPRCATCRACQALRLSPATFRPTRTQRRIARANGAALRLEVATPVASAVNLALYDRYHAYQTAAKDWPGHPPGDVERYHEAFVLGPFPSEEWRYFAAERLVCVSYVDELPDALSIIYCFYDPEERHRSLGTYNILRALEEAARRGKTYVHLGYYVEGCPSMRYKATFLPHELRLPDGRWRLVTAAKGDPA
jgi:arginine-tRNA-protein transferase